MNAAWGPFRPGLPPDERKASLRALRMATRLLTGARGLPATVALVRAEISGDDDLLDEAAAEFQRLPPVDRRCVMSAFAAVNYERVA